MKENFDIYDFDVVCDIESECEEVYDAKSFVNHIEENYKQEIDDVDDMPLVYIGICVALKKRNIQVPDELKQLIPTLLKNKNFIKRLGENESYLKSFKKWRTKFLKTLDNDEYNNVNIKYVSPFINWRENDIYMINVEETSEKERYVFLRVVEKKEENGKYYPIVYLFFMPGFSSNFSVDILDKIKYLPVSTRFDSRGLYDYAREIIDDFFRIPFEKEIKYLGNYKLKEPPNLVDTRKCYLRDRLWLPNIDNETIDIGLRILNRMERGERVGGDLFRYLNEP